MEHLSEKAQSARQALVDAAAEYQKVVDQVVEEPHGQYLERLRHAGENVAGAAARFVLEYTEGLEPDTDRR
jgi:hypothetical protein